MTSRGYRGNPRTLAQAHPRASDAAFLLVVAAFGVALIIAERLVAG